MRDLWRVLAWVIVTGGIVGGVDLWLDSFLDQYYLPQYYWCYPPLWYLIVSLIPAVWLCWKEE